MPRIGRNAEGSIKEDLLGLRLADLVLVAALALLGAGRAKSLN